MEKRLAEPGVLHWRALRKSANFRARVSTSRRALVFKWNEIDTEELEELKEVVRAELASWLGVSLVVHVA